MRYIDHLAEIFGSRECLGLLASAPDAGAIDVVYCLPSVGSASHAEAPPLAVKRAADHFAARGLVARGIWHSHGEFPVFHSGTDVATINRLLPSMAAANSRRDQPVKAPTVETPDSAVLPLDDGRVMTFTLAADSIPGHDFGAPLAWSRIELDAIEARSRRHKLGGAPCCCRRPVSG